jgi:hypothetical protein
MLHHLHTSYKLVMLFRAKAFTEYNRLHISVHLAKHTATVYASNLL